MFFNGRCDWLLLRRFLNFVPRNCWVSYLVFCLGGLIGGLGDGMGMGWDGAVYGWMDVVCIFVVWVGTMCVCGMGGMKH